jgi:hypothetical protein
MFEAHRDSCVGYTHFGEECFAQCISLSSVTFESGSGLSRIENREFYGSGLVEMVLPAAIESLGTNCCYLCGSLFSVFFELGSNLSRIEVSAFAISGVIEINVPAAIKFLNYRGLTMRHFKKLV